MLSDALTLVERYPMECLLVGSVGYLLGIIFHSLFNYIWWLNVDAKPKKNQ